MLVLANMPKGTIQIHICKLKSGTEKDHKFSFQPIRRDPILGCPIHAYI
jgi:hypothetical protein